jgi:hypothetical protein
MVNVNDRQRGNLRAESVIDGEPERNSMQIEIECLFLEEIEVQVVGNRKSLRLWFSK